MASGEAARALTAHGCPRHPTMRRTHGSRRSARDRRGRPSTQPVGAVASTPGGGATRSGSFAGTLGLEAAGYGQPDQGGAGSWLVEHCPCRCGRLVGVRRCSEIRRGRGQSAGRPWRGGSTYFPEYSVHGVHSAGDSIGKRNRGRPGERDPAHGQGCVGGRDAPHPPVEIVVAAGPAAGVLIDKSSEVDVLGTRHRGRGGFASMLLGPLSLQCVLHASCPVIVVRPSGVSGGPL